jgi:predicted deacylase
MKKLRQIIKEAVETNISGITAYTYDFGGPKRTLITGTIHGNEQTPIAAIKYFQQKLEKERNPKYGTITLIPCINTEGVIHNTREKQGKDLNREFGNGTSVDQIKAIQTLIDDYDVVIDIHTHGYCVSHIILDSLEQDVLFDWTSNSGVYAVGELESSTDADDLDKSLSYYALTKGKLACTLELNGVPSLNHKSAIEGCVVIDKLVTGESYGEAVSKYYRKELKVPFDCIFESIVDPGQSIQKEQILGYFRSPNGDKLGEMVSDYIGFVVSVELDSFVKSGNTCIYIGFRGDIK